MKRFEYKDLILEIDEEKTRDYYASLPECNGQGTRNFLEYSKQFSDIEKEFFDALCVDFSKLDIDLVKTKQRAKNCCGSFEIYVPGEVISSDESEEDIKIGSFRIVIVENDDSQDEKLIYIWLFYDDIPWLLNEKCENIDKQIPKILSGYYTVYNKIKPYFDKKKEIKCLKEFFSKKNIGFTLLNKKQTAEYQKQWVQAFLPSDLPEETMQVVYNACVKQTNYLWNLFSFDFIKPTVDDEAATAKFETLTDYDCVFFESFDKIAFSLSNVSNLKSSEIAKAYLLIDEDDVDEDYYKKIGDYTITAKDFSWTYCHTHEYGWIGPYYFEKSSGN